MFRTAFFAVLCAAALFTLRPLPAPASCLDETRPEPLNILFWSPEEQRCGYRNMGKLWPSNPVPRGSAVFPLPKGALPGLPDAERFMKSNGVLGLLILKDGAIVQEAYRGGFTEADTWTSFSMAKSITSILVGTAVKNGSIKSLDDPVVRYLPELAKSAYDGVTVRQLLTMTSGAAWNENYADPESDVAKLANLADNTEPVFLAYMAKLPRRAKPGTVFNYSTGEANLIGHLVRRATGKTLAALLSENIWAPMGMEQDALWITDKAGSEVSGCCFSATLRDYGRLGEFMLRGGKAGDAQRLPEGWITAATAASAPSRAQGSPYGFQWWVRDKGAYQASGIFGQMLHIDPRRNLVIVMLSAWPKAIADSGTYTARHAYIEAVKKAVDVDTRKHALKKAG